MAASFEHSPQRYLRLGGAIYLAIIALGVFGEVVARARLVAPGDAAATFNNIAGSPLLWRAGIVGDLLMHVLDFVGELSLALCMIVRGVDPERWHGRIER